MLLLLRLLRSAERTGYLLLLLRSSGRRPLLVLLLISVIRIVGCKALTLLLLSVSKGLLRVRRASAGAARRRRIPAGIKAAGATTSRRCRVPIVARHLLFAKNVDECA